MSGTIILNDVPRQGRSMTLSSSGSSQNQRLIMTSLQDAVQEYLKTPLASTLPQPLFATSSSVQLEEGMCQMLGVIVGMSDQALLDQGSQESKKNAWRSLKPGGTATPKWREYMFNSETRFSYVEEPWL